MFLLFYYFNFLFLKSKAVKILKDKDNNKDKNETEKMIIAEVEVLEKLDSPFIIKYYESFSYDDDEKKSSHMCISTEYCNVSLN